MRRQGAKGQTIGTDCRCLGCVYELLSFDSEVILFPGEARRRRIASCSVTEEQRSQGTKGLDSRRKEFVNTA